MSDTCKYKQCGKPASRVWDHPKFGFMCEEHTEELGTREVMTKCFNMTVPELKKGIAHYENLLDQITNDRVETDFMGRKKVFKAQKGLLHMVPSYARGLKIYKAVLEQKEGEVQ